MNYSTQKRFSVVIVHRNGVAMLLETIRSVCHACDPAQEEIILVDNGSCDASLAAVRSEFPQVVIIANYCNAGFARACNQGLSRAGGRYLLLLNNDTCVPTNLFDTFEAHFSTRPRLGLIGAQLTSETGHVHPSHGPLPSFIDAFDFKWRRHTPVSLDNHDLAEVDTIVGACMACRREALEAVGPLDEDFFFYFEEKEWCYRMHKHNWQVAVALDTRVMHSSGASTRGLRKEAELEMFHSRLLFNRKTFSRPQAWLLNSYWLARLVVNCFANALATLATLGCCTRARGKFNVYSYLLAWQLCGRPQTWGLPDKCRRTHGSQRA